MRQHARPEGPGRDLDAIAHDHVDHAGDGGDADGRVAVVPDDGAVREGLHQRVQGPQMRGRLQEPAFAGTLPVQQPQQIRVVAIERAQVVAGEPAGVGLEHQLVAELAAVEAEGVEQHALLGRVGVGEVGLGEVGVVLARLLGHRLHGPVARVLLPGRQVPVRIREDAFPKQQRTRRGIGGQQVEERRGPGARQPRQEHRAHDLALANLWVAAKSLLDLEPGREQLNQGVDGAGGGPSR